MTSTVTVECAFVHLNESTRVLQSFRIPGETDVHQIADRFKKMFPTLLPSKYSPEQFKFGISNRERTNQSLQAFIERIFDESEMSKIVYPTADVKVRPTIMPDIEAQFI